MNHNIVWTFYCRVLSKTQLEIFHFQWTYKDVSGSTEHTSCSEELQMYLIRSLCASDIDNVFDTIVTWK
jgi:hypothetical protein